MSDPSGPRKETVRITLPPRAAPHPTGAGGEARDTVRINLPAKPPGNGFPSGIPHEPPKRAMPPPPPPSKRDLPAPIASTPAPPRPVPPPPPPTPTPVRPPPSFAAPPRPPILPPNPPPLRPPTVPPLPLKPPVSALEEPQEIEQKPVAPPMPPRPRVLPPPPRVPSATGPASSVTPAPAIYPGSGPSSGPRQETARITILPETAPAAAVRMAKTQPLMTVPQPAIQSAPVIVPAKADPATTGAAGDWLARLDTVPLPICWAIFGISTVTLLIQIWNYVSS